MGGVDKCLLRPLCLRTFRREGLMQYNEYENGLLMITEPSTAWKPCYANLYPRLDCGFGYLGLVMNRNNL